MVPELPRPASGQRASETHAARPAAWKSRQKADPARLLYRPSEVAKMLRCSEWWIKEQARNRRIPFSWIGGSYLFTSEHIAEIVQLFETRPTPPNVSSRAPNTPTRHGKRSAIRPKTPLKARRPRRTLNVERQEID